MSEHQPCLLPAGHAISFEGLPITTRKFRELALGTKFIHFSVFHVDAPITVWVVVDPSTNGGFNAQVFGKDALANYSDSLDVFWLDL